MNEPGHTIAFGPREKEVGGRTFFFSLPRGDSSASKELLFNYIAHSACGEQGRFALHAA